MNAEKITKTVQRKGQKGTLFLLTLIPWITAAAVGRAQTPLSAAAPAPLADAPAIQTPGREQLDTLRVSAGKSLVVNSPEALKRVSLSDPAIASAIITSPNQVLIHGRSPGRITLLLWDDKERVRSLDLHVDFDTVALRETLRQVLPEETIQVTPSGQSLILSGNVSSKEAADKALALAQSVTKNIVNMMNTTRERNEVLLQVRFAEVDRAAIQNLGINILSTGGANTVGSVSTGQFQQPLGNVGAVPAGAQRGKDPQSPSVVSGGIGTSLRDSPAVFGLSELLNVFVFRPDLNLGAVIKALQQRNVLQILAEPNLLALNGREASFLAGGEFPIPILQGGGAFQGITIQFKEFGVRLKFTPNILSDGTIRLKVSQEVSSLDVANALTVAGFIIPALSTRRAETEVELRDGQSFAIAGLIDNRTTETVSKIPWLGDVPILGNLFKSRAQNRNNTELLVMVTPRQVRPLGPGEVPASPTFLVPFLNKERFDGEVGPVPDQRSLKPPEKKLLPGEPHEQNK